MSFDRALVLFALLAVAVLATQVLRLHWQVQVLLNARAITPEHPEVGTRLPFDEGPDYLRRDEFSALRDGRAVAVLLQPGCVACKRVKQELTSAPPKWSTFVFMGAPDWQEKNAAGQTKTDDGFPVNGFLPVEPQKSFGYADTFPTLMALKDGVVTSTAHRLADLKTS